MTHHGCLVKATTRDSSRLRRHSPHDSSWLCRQDHHDSSWLRCQSHNDSPWSRWRGQPAPRLRDSPRRAKAAPFFRICVSLAAGIGTRVPGSAGCGAWGTRRSAAEVGHHLLLQLRRSIGNNGIALRVQLPRVLELLLPIVCGSLFSGRPLRPSVRGNSCRCLWSGLVQNMFHGRCCPARGSGFLYQRQGAIGKRVGLFVAPLKI
jgi:hypothetical protein